MRISTNLFNDNTDYLDAPVTFERVGFFGCGFQQTYSMDILFQQAEKKPLPMPFK